MGHYIYLCYQLFKIGKMKITKKKIAWGIVLLILIVGGVICKIRWKVWFHNIPEITLCADGRPATGISDIRKMTANCPVM